ncbi:MAG: hypothetical protein HKN29_15250 [Rhodothermales bacterium]|nr:hypothetical protein [Rhodothermales bacterium]
MSDDTTNKDAFHDLRKGFDELQVDEQARFLVEAAMSLVSHGAREAGNVVQTVVDDIVENIKRETEACAPDADEAEEEAPEAKAKPKAKPAAKKTTTRKRTPRKPSGDSGDAA